MTLVIILNSVIWFAAGFILYDFYYRPMPDRVIRKFRTLNRVIKVWSYRNSDAPDEELMDKWIYAKRGEIDQSEPYMTAQRILDDFGAVQAVEVMDGSMVRGCVVRR